MAKLNGVTIVSERISYNGAEYVKSDESAVKGDILRWDNDEYSSLVEGAFYEVDRIDTCDDAQIIDEDGDEFDTSGDDFTVFKRVESAEAPSNIVTYEGAQYRRLTRKAVEGDLIIAIKPDHECDDYGVGFIARLFMDGELRFNDAVGDSRDFFKYHEDNFVVLEPIAPAQPAASPTTTLPDTYVIHDGKVYRKEARMANVGELAYRTLDLRGRKAGSVTRAKRMGSFAPIAEDGTSLFDDIHVVLIPTDSVTFEVNGVAAEYTLEKRGANYEETILCVESSDDGRYEFGDIGKVTDDCPGLPNVTWRNGKETAISSSRFVVLVPKAAAQPAPKPAAVGDRIRIVNARGTSGKYDNGDEFIVKSVYEGGTVFVAEHSRPIAQDEYEIISQQPQSTVREVKRKANVGERIRIVAAEATSGLYVNGDEFEATRITGAGGACFTTEEGEAYACLREYVVLVPKAYEPQPGDKVRGKSSGSVYTLTERKPEFDERGWGKAWGTGSGRGGYIGEDQFELIERAADVKEPEPDRLKIGDYAKVIANKACHTYDIGSIVKLVKVGGYRSDGFIAEKLDGTLGNVLREGDGEIVRATDAEVAEAQRKVTSYNVSVGDYVRVVKPGGGHDYTVGDIVKVTSIVEVSEEGTLFHAESITTGIRGNCLSTKQTELLTQAEAEEKAQQAAETAKWAAIGRKVGEYKRGDIVSADYDGRSLRRLTGKVEDIGDTLIGLRLFDESYRAVRQKGAELVAPVESLFNR
ncbi:hypothetical protein [Paenibacillus sp. SI8]|uniref:hypothetical protein n=1 Tax=unclassified Paenibacillus TaxID=185978 RepID=UPI003465F54E